MKKYITSRSIQDVFRDSFYYWLFKYWEEKVDLIKTNKYFKPLISYEEFLLLQNKFIKKRVFNKTKNSPYSKLQPFSDDFIITEDWFKCSFYLSHSWKWKEEINFLENNNIDYSCESLKISTKYLHYKIPSKSIIYNEISFISTNKITEKLHNSISNIKLTRNLLNKIIKKWTTKL